MVLAKYQEVLQNYIYQDIHVYHTKTINSATLNSFRRPPQYISSRCQCRAHIQRQNVTNNLIHISSRCPLIQRSRMRHVASLPIFGIGRHQGKFRSGFQEQSRRIESTMGPAPWRSWHHFAILMWLFSTPSSSELSSRTRDELMEEMWGLLCGVRERLTVCLPK